MIEFDFEGHAKSQIDKGLGYLEGFSKGYHQAKSEWVGLTNNELVDLAIKNAGFPILLAEAIEAKLKNRNT